MEAEVIRFPVEKARAPARCALLVDFTESAELVMDLVDVDEELYPISVELERICQWASEAVDVAPERPVDAAQAILEIRRALGCLKEALWMRRVRVAVRNVRLEKRVLEGFQCLDDLLRSIAREIET